MKSSYKLIGQVDQARSSVAYHLKNIKQRRTDFDFSSFKSASSEGWEYWGFKLSDKSDHPYYRDSLGEIQLREIDNGHTNLSIIDPDWFFMRPEEYLITIPSQDQKTINEYENYYQRFLTEFTEIKRIKRLLRNRITANLIKHLRADEILANTDIELATDKPRMKEGEDNYISQSRIKKLSSTNAPKFNLSKLIQLCEAINLCYSNGCYAAVAILGRVLLDHIPPIFGEESFTAVVNNYNWSTSNKSKHKSSSQKMMQRLNNSLRDLADLHIHLQIDNKLTMPERPDVDFRSEIALLLDEIIYILNI